MFPEDNLFARAVSVSLYDAGQIFETGHGEGGAFGEYDFTVAQIGSYDLERLYRSLGFNYVHEKYRSRSTGETTVLSDTYCFSRGATTHEDCKLISVFIDNSSLLHMKITHKEGWVQRVTYSGRYAIDWMSEGKDESVS